jgi:hypothetical protein
MRPALTLLVLLSVPASLAAQGPAAADVIAAYRRMAAHSPWPGFDAGLVPVAVFDGDTTWLSGHPHPPLDTFRLAVGGLYAMPGRHPAITANSSAELGGVMTATLLLDRTRSTTATSWAATLTHEAFHVYQRGHHKDWVANEADFFTYPADREAPQRLQRLETEAWRRALTGGRADCWTRTALKYRQLRFALLPVDAIAYERGTELNEGLATYVEYRAGRRDTIPFPAEGFGPEEVRLRGYVLGPAIGRMLDRFAPAWRDGLERGPTRSLDELLTTAMTPGEGCRFLPGEEDSVTALARAEIAQLQARHQALRDSVTSAPGWRIEIVADSAAPLWPERFDPWNVVSVGNGAVVHRRALTLSKDGLKVELFDRAGVTEAMGAHPIFNGIRRLIIGGLPDAPTVVERPGQLELTAPGVRITGRVRAVERNGQAIRIFAGP